MGAYNKVDGVHACENRALLTGVLREMWGFDGWVMSDWDATHSTVPSLTAGLDMEMPAGRWFGDALRRAVRDGTVPEDAVDRSVRRILTVMARFGLLDGTAPARPAARDREAGARLAYRVAVAGATLLRNEHATLPLTGPAARSVAVIGPTGTVPFASGGGSAHVVPDRADSPLAAITARAGDGAHVTYALGEDLYGKPLPVRGAAFEGQRVRAGKTYTYEGTLTLDDPDEWTFLVHYTGTRPQVFVDGTELFTLRDREAELFAGFGLVSTAPDGLKVRRRTLRLTAGRHTLRVTATGGTQGQLFRLRRITTATRAADVAEAVRVARAAHSVVLFAYEDAAEGRDRTTLALPGHQEALIDAVTAANPRTTVVLNTSSAVTMPWLDRTGAVLQMYYPGQEGAAATAAVLFGDTDPGGRLTQTFPVSDTRHPMAGNPRRYPGTGGIQEYSEGIRTGYRWYDAEGVEPLFPFGHGLSYTTFAYAGLAVTPAPGGGLTARFTVRNTGRRTGVTVAQLYAGPSPDLTLDQPARALAGYRRIELRPGQFRHVTVPIPARTLSCWDPERHTWALGTGTRTIRLGTSSRDLRLTARAEVLPL